MGFWADRKRRHEARLERKAARFWWSEFGLALEDGLLTDRTDGKVYNARYGAARVDMAGAAETVQRLTATRMVTFGLFTIAVPKRRLIDHRDAYLTISGPGWEIVKFVPSHAILDARRLAALINMEL